VSTLTFPPIQTVHGLIEDHTSLPTHGAAGDAWYEENAGLLWVWDQDLGKWRDLNLWHGKGFAASVANLVGLRAAGRPSGMNADVEAPGVALREAAPTGVTNRTSLVSRNRYPERRLVGDLQNGLGSASDSAVAFLVGEPVDLRLSFPDVLRRAQTFAVADALKNEPFCLSVPDILAREQPDSFALRFPSGVLCGVTAQIKSRTTSGLPAPSPVIEFLNPMELIDPEIDDQPAAHFTVTLYAFRRAGALTNVA